MTVAAIREKLHGYIDSVDEKQIKNIYSLFEDQIAAPTWEWSEDEEFVAELNERVKRYEAGIDPGFSIEEAKTSLQEMKSEYLKARKK